MNARTNSIISSYLSDCSAILQSRSNSARERELKFSSFDIYIINSLVIKMLRGSSKIRKGFWKLGLEEWEEEIIWMDSIDSLMPARIVD